MKIDDSFKKPGSVPFKWEVRPGVPKAQNPQTPSRNPHFDFGHQRKHLKPPPAGSNFRPHLEPRPDSIRASPRTSSHRFGPMGLPRSDSIRASPGTSSHRFGPTGLARPEIVSSSGCFPSPLLKRKNTKPRVGDPRSRPGYYSDPDTPPRWSVSSRKSATASPLSSSLASYQSSPRLVSDADWMGFGLF